MWTRADLGYPGAQLKPGFLARLAEVTTKDEPVLERERPEGRRSSVPRS
jgi:hypothetical protein